MLVQPYLNFDGKCEEAIEFYRQALGAEVLMLMRFKDSPEPCAEGDQPAGNENKVMHASLKIGDSTLMASDCYAKGQPKFEGISLALSPALPKAEGVFTALAAGGKVEVPLTKTFFSPAFGVVTDKFGVSWTIAAPGEGM